VEEKRQEKVVRLVEGREDAVKAAVRAHREHC
jgi:hypothetical protein